MSLCEGKTWKSITMAEFTPVVLIQIICGISSISSRIIFDGYQPNQTKHKLLQITKQRTAEKNGFKRNFTVTHVIFKINEIDRTYCGKIKLVIDDTESS